MAEDALMTNEEALTFLRETLGISSPETKLKDDPLAFLNEFVLAWCHHIPFQSVKAISIPHKDRHKPTFPEIKADVFSKIGGLCYEHNVCCGVLLRTIGFNVSLVTSDISFEDSHVIVIVHGVSDTSSMHMVDVGSGYPTLRIVPLDFEKQSPEYHDSYLRYRFVRQGDLIICDHHADTDPRAALWPDRVKDGWYSFIFTHFTQPKEISYFDDVMTRIYTTLLKSPPYLTSPRCMAWPNGRFVCIKDTTLLVEDEEGRVEKTYFKSRDDVFDAYAKHFPQISKEIVQAVLDDEWVNLDFNKKLLEQGHA